MTLPTSGPISLFDIANELGVGMPLSLTDSRVLALAGKSAPVTLPGDFYGKSASPAAQPFTVSKKDASGSAISTTSGGTVSCSPSVTEMGGVPPYSRTWSFTSNPNGCTLADATAAFCTVWHTYARNSSGTADATLQCVSVDSAGAQVVTTGVLAYLEWNGNQ